MMISEVDAGGPLDDVRTRLDIVVAAGVHAAEEQSAKPLNFQAVRVALLLLQALEVQDLLAEILAFEILALWARVSARRGTQIADEDMRAMIDTLHQLQQLELLLVCWCKKISQQALDELRAVLPAVHIRK